MNGPTRDVEGDRSFAVTIVAYNGADSIAGVVAAARGLAGCTRVVVVDNGADGAGAVAEAAGAEVIARPDNPGFGTAQNVAVARCDEPFVLLLNPDAEPVGDEPLARGISLLVERPDVAAVQGAVINIATGVVERSMGRSLGPVHLYGRAIGARRWLGSRVGRLLARRVGAADHVARRPDAPIEVETLAATAILVRRDAFAAVGGFDERIFLYGEDLDLCRRWREAGFRLVGLPDDWVRHESGGTADSSWDREVAWWEGTLQFAARWWTPMAWWGVVPAVLLQALVLVIERPSRRREVWRALLRRPLAFRRAKGQPPAGQAVG